MQHGPADTDAFQPSHSLDYSIALLNPSLQDVWCCTAPPSKWLPQQAPAPCQRRPSPAQPSPAQPSPAQPSPAQPSPAQPSPAQPSPAQRSVARSTAQRSAARNFAQCGTLQDSAAQRSGGAQRTSSARCRGRLGRRLAAAAGARWGRGRWRRPPAARSRPGCPPRSGWPGGAAASLRSGRSLALQARSGPGGERTQA